MKEIYFTLTATNHYYGSEFLTPGTRLTLKKEPDNQQDSAASVTWQTVPTPS